MPRSISLNPPLVAVNAAVVNHTVAEYMSLSSDHADLLLAVDEEIYLIVSLTPGYSLINGKSPYYTRPSIASTRNTT